MTKFLFLIATLFCSLSAIAKEIPDWVNHKPADDTDLKYYVGVGMNRDCEKAEEDIRNQILNELGSQITSVFESNLSENDNTMQQTLKQKSSAKLKGLKRVAFYTSEGKYPTCYILDSYPQKEFEKESKKIDQNLKDVSTEEKSVIKGRKSYLKNSVIFTTTDNIQVTGYINEKKYTFPAKYVNEFEPGAHTIQFVDDHYTIKNVQFKSLRNTETEVQIIVQRATGSIIVKAPADDVELEINGKKYSPNNEYTFEAGKELIIRAKHPSYTFEPQIVIPIKNKTKTVILDYTSKEAKLILNFDKKITSLSIDDTTKSAKKREFDIAPTEHKITIKIDGIKKSKHISATSGGIVELSLDDFTEDNEQTEDGLISLSITPFVPKYSGYYKNKIDAKFIENDYDFSYLKPTFYYKQVGGHLMFITQVSFDEKKYKKNYQKPLLESLKRLSYTNKVLPVQTFDLFCDTNKKLNTVLCNIDADPENTTAYVRTGNFKESFLNDKGDFYVVKNFPNFLRKKGFVQQQDLEVFVTIFNDKDEKLLSFTHPFVLNHFEKKDLLYLFNPTLNADREKCKFKGEKQTCGGTKISFTNIVNFFDFSKKYKVLVGIGVAP